MKNELKISTLSIVCALCTAVSVPAFGAPAVRSLGGAGTYNSASNAAAAKTSGSVINSVRGGAMRVNSGTTTSKTSASTTSTRSGSTSRVATTPRLSIGKYLSKSPTLGKPGVVNPGQSGNDNGNESGNLQDRIKVLEEFMGYGPGDDIPTQFADLGLRVDELELAADLGVESVTYADGILSVKDFGATDAVEYDLKVEFAGKSEIDQLQAALDAIVAEQYLTADDLAEYALKSELPKVDGLASSAELAAAVELLEASIAALESTGDASAADLTALQNQVTGLISKSDATIADVAAVQQSVAAIESDNMVTKGAVKTLQDTLAGVVADYLTSADLAEITAALALKANAADVYTKTEVYTKAEVDTAIANAAFDEATLNNYYDKTAADAKFATADALDTLGATVAQKADTTAVNTLGTTVGGIQESVATLEQSVASAASAASAAQLAADAVSATISGYGDVVTHNASEFATAAQGVLAATAVQPNDLSEFATKSDVTAELGDYATLESVSGLSDDVTQLSQDLGTVSSEIANKANKSDLDSKQEKLIAGNFISIGEDGKTITTTYKSSESVLISDDGSLSVADDYVTAVDLSDHNMPQGQLAMLVQGEDGQGIWVPINIVSE